ncbi:hypothetical protein ACE7GA_23595 [Roseomonas sp. CCTCC AB2023176]|uniref:hypothetical protein n=1 Tax=Roseomonas sp. CCTCC AB2023176 TaxID=3342640 RepID=UPI0035E098E1
MFRTLALFFVVLAVPGVARAQAGIDAQQVIRAERAANEACRGGRGDANETWQACGRRDALGEVLGELGWCYGRAGEAGHQQQWHRCDASSRRQRLPR